MMLLILKNLGRAAAIFFVVTLVTFVLMHTDGRGLARATLPLNAKPYEVDIQLIKLGLDRPVLLQYGDWLVRAATGDLGRSFYTSESVSSALSNRVPVTLTLVALTLLFTVLISAALGITAAVRGGWVDRLLQLLSIGGNAIPAFIVSIILVFAFAIAWRIFPATGFIPISAGVGDWAKSLALPVTALLIGSVANAAQQFRTAVLDTLGRDFVRTLRARGVSEREIILRNVLRNSAAPGVTVLGLQTFSILGGAVFIEQVFALAGMGQLAASAAQIQDIPMVMGTVLVTILIVLAVNFVVDLSIIALNPKARTR